MGADEPRYAQIAYEMLQAHHNGCVANGNAKVIPRSLHWHDLRASFHCAESGTITPILYGHPWLEKPALYYWRTMSFFKEFGTSDWVARLPSATGAFGMVFLIFLHMRRFRPGGHLDAALITASATAIVAFARGASTDMQLAAPFAIGMLGWYAWYETARSSGSSTCTSSERWRRSRRARSHPSLPSASSCSLSAFGESGRCCAA